MCMEVGCGHYETALNSQHVTSKNKDILLPNC